MPDKCVSSSYLDPSWLLICNFHTHLLEHKPWLSMQKHDTLCISPPLWWLLDSTSARLKVWKTSIQTCIVQTWETFSRLGTQHESQGKIEIQCMYRPPSIAFLSTACFLLMCQHIPSTVGISFRLLYANKMIRHSPLSRYPCCSFGTGSHSDTLSETLLQAYATCSHSDDVGSACDAWGESTDLRSFCPRVGRRSSNMDAWTLENIYLVGAAAIKPSASQPWNYYPCHRIRIASEEHS
jgi:hypothetical protein